MKKLFTAVGVGSAGLLASASASFAALDLTGVTLDTTDVEGIMLIVIPALAVLWGFRKIVKTMNRS